MMTSENIFPRHFSRIDDLTRPDHYYLTEADECYFLGEYTAGAGFSYSSTNDVIFNFKKEMDRRGLPEWPYKGRAIKQAAGAFRVGLRPMAFKMLTFVPIPPSRACSDPLYDDRLINMLRAIQPDLALDIRELILQTQNTPAAHTPGPRPTPAQLQGVYRIDESLSKSPRQIIAIVDDVITTGAHFKAAKMALSDRIPDVQIIGLFIARRVPET